MELSPGEETTVDFHLDARAFAYWNTEISDWHVEGGDFEILVGPSSADVPLRATVHVASTTPSFRKVTRKTKFYQLLDAPQTRSITQEILDREVRNLNERLAQMASERPESAEHTQRFIENVMREMRYADLRALAGLFGRMPEAELAEFIDRLNRAIGAGAED